MGIVVVGGHSRSIGKTSVVAGLISALPEFNWTALKITQYGHGVCSAHGGACDCATPDHSWAISEETDHSGGSDTSRFLVAGAERAFWVRTQQRRLAEAMPRVRSKIAGAKNVIMESNSVIRFLRPDLYLMVLDPQQEDFKSSAREFMDRADAIILHQLEGNGPRWEGVSLKRIAGRPIFFIDPPAYVSAELVEFVRARVEIVA